MNVITIARQPRGKGLRSKKAKRRKRGVGVTPSPPRQRDPRLTDFPRG
jgi:hypothetical protein